MRMIVPLAPVFVFFNGQMKQKVLKLRAATATVAARTTAAGVLVIAAVAAATTAAEAEVIVFVAVAAGTEAGTIAAAEIETTKAPS